MKTKIINAKIVLPSSVMDGVLVTEETVLNAEDDVRLVARWAKKKE